MCIFEFVLVRELEMLKCPDTFLVPSLETAEGVRLGLYHTGCISMFECACIDKYICVLSDNSRAA